MNIFKRMASVFKKPDKKGLMQIESPQSNDHTYDVDCIQFLCKFVLNNKEDTMVQTSNKYFLYKNHSSAAIIERIYGYYTIRPISLKLFSSSELYAIKLLVSILNCKIDLNISNNRMKVVDFRNIIEFEKILSNLEHQKAMIKIASYGIKTSDLKGIHDEKI